MTSQTLIIDSGVRSSLDKTCKHQMTFCKFSIKIPRIPPSKRLVCHYDTANRELINRAIIDFKWEVHLNKRPNPNSQVKFLNQTHLNIITNFVPSSTIHTNIIEPKWITRDIKNLHRPFIQILLNLNGSLEISKIFIDHSYKYY